MRLSRRAHLPASLIFFISAFSLLFLGLFAQVNTISAVNHQVDEVDRSSVSSVAKVAPLQQLVAHVTLNEIELQANGTEVQALVDEIPNDAVVTGVEFKLSIPHEGDGLDLQAIESYFSAPGRSLVNLSADKSEIVEEAARSSRTPSRSYAVISTREQAEHFNGAAAQGEWRVNLLAKDNALVGQKASVTLVIHYTARVHLPNVKGGNQATGAAILRLPASIELPQTRQAQSSQQRTADGWEVIESEDFEGAFPTGNWTVTSASDDGYERYWDKDDYKPHNGGFSAWPVKGGADGLDPEYNYYANNMYSWMVYGPFDLSDATDAQSVFHIWHEIEVDYDYVFFGVSADGNDFNSLRWDGSSDWREEIIGYPEWAGNSTVWVAWGFYSDDSNVYDGPFVDDIEIRKLSSTTPSATNTPTPQPTSTPRATNTPIPTSTPSPTPTTTAREAITLHAWVGQESINLEWDLIHPLSGNLDRYQLKRNANGGNYEVIHSGLNNQYTDADSTLTPNVEYCYQVEALNSANNVIGYSNVSCAEVGKAKLWIPDQVVEPNAENVPVTINLANGNGICIRSLDITVTYDHTIAQANGTVLPTIYTQGYAFETDTSIAGQVKISSITGAEQCVPLYGPGSLFDVFFNVQGHTGQVSSFDFVTGLTGTVIYDRDDLFTPIPLILNNGSLLVGSTFVRGDINGDEVVNAADSAFALDISNQAIAPTQQQKAACDVNGDAVCNSADSSLILCYAATQNWNACIAPHLNQRHAQATEPTHNSQIVKVAIGAISYGPSTIRVPVQISNADGFTGGDFTLTYDPNEMIATGASLSSLTNGFELRTNSEEAGMLKVSLASNEQIIPNGTIFQVEFTVKRNVSSIDFASVRLHDVMGRDFETSVLQRDLELVPYDEHRLYLPAVIR